MSSTEKLLNLGGSDKFIKFLSKRSKEQAVSSALELDASSQIHRVQFLAAA